MFAATTPMLAPARLPHLTPVDTAGLESIDVPVPAWNERQTHPVATARTPQELWEDKPWDPVHDRAAP